MGLAPELPSAETLNAMHPLSDAGRQKVYKKRKEVSDALISGRKLLAIIGPCAMTNDEEVILDENRKITEFGQRNDMVVLHRLPPWKPRTNPDSWFGLETTDPEVAHRLTVAVAEQSGNLAMEFGHQEHIRRYLGQAALAWRGSRNDDEKELLQTLVTTEETLPLAIKNGMSGFVQSTHIASTQASMLRHSDNHAPVTMIFCGGEGLQTPHDWLGEYAQLFTIRGGRFIVDLAHGSEQAYDPEGKFGKSALGQLACLGSINSLAEFTTQVPYGVMIEASDIKKARQIQSYH